MRPHKQNQHLHDSPGYCLRTAINVYRAARPIEDDVQGKRLIHSDELKAMFPQLATYGNAPDTSHMSHEEEWFFLHSRKFFPYHPTQWATLQGELLIIPITKGNFALGIMATDPKGRAAFLAGDFHHV